MHADNAFLPLGALAKIVDVREDIFGLAVDLDALMIGAICGSLRLTGGTVMTTRLVRLIVWRIRVGESSAPTIPRSGASAEATRLAIVDAAGRLFAERGYAATSIEDVAGAAAVGRATVFNSVGGKPELLKEAYRLAVRGPANANTPLGQQARSRKISAEADAHKLLAGDAGVMVEVGRRFARSMRL